MKTSGFRCETKFGLLVFLGHPNGQQRACSCMPVYIGKSGDLVGCYRCLTHSQTENRATQLVSSIKHKLSHAIMSDKLLLKWNDFQENVNTSFANLKEDKEFADVTLVCEDDQQVEAHRVILAASSPFFENILKKNRHPTH